MFMTWITYSSVSICLAGIVFKMMRWFTLNIGPEAQTSSFFTRIAGFFNAAAGTLPRPARLAALARTIFADILLQLHILRQNRLRWFIHIFLFYGVLFLVLLHVFDRSITAGLFDDYAPTLNPFQFGRHLLGAMVLTGVIIAYVRRRRNSTLRQTSSRADRWMLGLIGAIIISGALMEATQIISSALFDEMVVDYMGSDDPEEIAPLKAYWASEYHVVFTPAAAADDPDLLAEGQSLHADFCAACHTPPVSAFMAYPLALTMKPVAAALDAIRIDLWLWRLHYMLSCLALALLPFTKLFHLLTTPLNLLIGAGGPAADQRPGNRPARRALGLSACTHCSVCTEHCAVAPIEQVLGNLTILPSQKLKAVAANAAGRLTHNERAALSEGSFICTSCGRCTTQCPSKIDLHDLWQASRSDLARNGYPAPHGWIRTRTAAAWSQQLREEPGANTVAANPASQPVINLCDNADTFQACVQCTTCTSVCPVVALCEDPRRDLDLTPQQVMNLMRLRLKTMALGSRMVWNCVTCYKCQEHCPQGVRVADVLYELRNEACRKLQIPDAVNNIRQANERNTLPGGQ